jgi:hypothetical protein
MERASFQLGKSLSVEPGFGSFVIAVPRQFKTASPGSIRFRYAAPNSDTRPRNRALITPAGSASAAATGRHGASADASARFPEAACRSAWVSRWVSRRHPKPHVHRIHADLDVGLIRCCNARRGTGHPWPAVRRARAEGVGEFVSRGQFSNVAVRISIEGRASLLLRLLRGASKP